MFERKTKKQKEISKLKNQLYKYQQLRDFWGPRVRKRLFRDDEIEVISNWRIKKMLEYEEKIKHIQQKLMDLK